MAEASHRRLRNLRDGVMLTCPACREGRMFSGLSMHAECPRCGAPLEHDPGEWTGPMMFVMGGIGMVALMGWFLLVVLLQAPAWLGWAWLAWWAVIFPVAFYRNFKGLWVGILYAARGPDQPLGTDEVRRP